MQIKIISTGIPIIIVGTAVFFSCQKTDNFQSQHPEIPVKVAAVQREYISFPIHANGLLASPKEVKLSFKVGGIIKNIPVDEGDRVIENQLLATLEKSEIEAMTKQARSGFEKAQRDFERVSSLYQDSVATLEQKQDTETALKVARSNLEIAEFNLKHASIFAPSAGKILKRLAENNELISPGTPVYIFGSTEGAWIIRTSVSDRDIVRIQFGDSASVSFDAYPDRKFSAQVTEIAQSADPYTGTFEVELTLREEQKMLVFGFVANVEMYPSRGDTSTIIPIEALAEADANIGTVFTLDSVTNTVRRVQVGIDRIFDEKIAISHGLENVSHVITAGTAYLREGSVVKVESAPNL